MHINGQQNCAVAMRSPYAGTYVTAFMDSCVLNFYRALHIIVIITILLMSNRRWHCRTVCGGIRETWAGMQFSAGSPGSAQSFIGIRYRCAADDRAPDHTGNYHMLEPNRACQAVGRARNQYIK